MKSISRTVLTVILALPIWAQSQTSIITALQNQRGTGTPIAPIARVGGAINVLGSQSYTYVVPLFGTPGRHGLNLDLALAYNSAIWTAATANSVEWNPDMDTLSPGFRLDFGCILWNVSVGVTSGGVLIDPSGAKHSLVDSADGFGDFKTVDSTHIWVHHGTTTDVVTYKDGTQATYQFGFQSALGGVLIMQPVKIQDVLGNAISINYSAATQFSTPAITSVVDTVGRTINFFYTSSPSGNRLSCVTDGAFCGATGARTFSFNWNTAYILNYNFGQVVFNGWSALPPFMGSQVPYVVLSGVTRPDGTRVQFNYGDWMIVDDVQEFSNNGSLRYENLYNFPLASAGTLTRPPSYTQETVTMFDQAGNRTQNIWTYQSTLSNTTFPFVTCYAMIDPVGVIAKTQFSSNGDVYDGLPIQTVVGSGSATPCTDRAIRPSKTVTTQWTSDTISGTPTGINARPLSVTTTLDDSITQSQKQFTFDGWGNITDIKEYDNGFGVHGPLLREIVNTFAYNLGNVFIRPADIQVKDGLGALVAHSTFAYDLTNGNLTTTTEYADAVHGLSPIVNTFTYDQYGNQLTQKTGCCTFQQRSYSATTNFAYPDSVTVGPVGDPASLTTAYTYNFNNGTIASIKDANGQLTTFTYDLDLRPTGATRPDGVTISTAYDDSGANKKTTTSNSANSKVTTTTTNFLGSTLRKDLLTNASLISTTAFVNDAIGRPTQISNPYGPSDTPVYTAYSYDPLGRVVLTTPPVLAGVTQQKSYQTNYSGATATFIDPAGNQRMHYVDGLGRLVRVDEPGDAVVGTPAGGSVNIIGTLQTGANGGTPAQSAVGSITINGAELSQTIPGQRYCAAFDLRGRCVDFELTPSTTIYDSGTVNLYVNGQLFSYTYGASDSLSSIASALASSIRTNSPTTDYTNIVTNTLVNPPTSTISLVAKAAGAAGNNITLAIGATSWDSTDFVAASFRVQVSGATLGGGTQAVAPVPYYDAGMVTMSIGIYSATANYGNTAGQDANGATIASDLVGKINVQLPASGAPFSIGSSPGSSMISISFAAAGPQSVSFTSTTSQTSHFSVPSFAGGCQVVSNPQPCTIALGGTNSVPSSLANPYTTSYAYDPLGDLITMTQGQQTRTFGFDNLGRMTSSSVPESGNRPTVYTYTDFRALATKTDPRGIVTTYGYDSLNRLKSVAYSDGTPAESYFYGSTGAPNFAAGRPTSAANATASETYQYDNMGRLLQVSKMIGVNPYNLAYSYNLDGTVKTVTYPSGRVITNAYDSLGRLIRVSSGSTTYLSINSYNAASLVLSTTYGNSMAGAYAYNNQLQVSSILAQNAAPVLSLSYNYGGASNNGQIVGITDNVTPSSSTSYSYDSLSRLATAQTLDHASPATWGLSFGYDRFGNRLQETPISGTSLMPGSQLVLDASTNHVISAGFSYDMNGNSISDGTATYGYDGANRMSTATPVGGGTTYTYKYDSAGQRVSKNGNYYVFGRSGVIAEYANGALASSPSAEYVYAGGQRVANIIAGATTYNYWDHASIRVNADSTGNVIRTSNTFPFGESMLDTSNPGPYLSKWKFTSFERDVESNLDHAWFRQYSDSQGRWASPDPYFGSMRLSSPQSLNRYSYGANNPILFGDPSGLACRFFMGINTPVGRHFSEIHTNNFSMDATYPYPEEGKLKGVLDVIGQEAGSNTNSTNLADGFNQMSNDPPGSNTVFFWSGAAEALLTSAYDGKLNEAALVSVKNAVFVSPGEALFTAMEGDNPFKNRSTIFHGKGVADFGATIVSRFGLGRGDGFPCKHGDLSCMLSNMFAKHSDLFSLCDGIKTETPSVEINLFPYQIQQLSFDPWEFANIPVVEINTDCPTCSVTTEVIGFSIGAEPGFWGKK